MNRNTHFKNCFAKRQLNASNFMFVQKQNDKGQTHLNHRICSKNFSFYHRLLNILTRESEPVSHKSESKIVDNKNILSIHFTKYHEIGNFVILVKGYRKIC
jgi:hypothetical protein